MSGLSRYVLTLAEFMGNVRSSYLPDKGSHAFAVSKTLVLKY